MRYANMVKVNVKGVTFDNRQDKLKSLYRDKGAYLTLKRQPTNPADPNAIKVLVHLSNGTVFHAGYIPKELAAQFAPYMDRGGKVTVRSWRLVGGGKFNLGVEMHVIY